MVIVIRSCEVIIEIVVVLAFIPAVLSRLLVLIVAGVVDAFVVLKTLVPWFQNIFRKFFFHILLVALQLEVTHFVEVGIFVIKLLKVRKIILTPFILIIIEFPRLICSIHSCELVFCWHNWCLTCKCPLVCWQWCLFPCS